uniref:Ig-like domain-containing protein n=1 Tax=Electrophorus electricus TaxID=8005 RepID=A0A4W4H190_ELEEL
MIAYFFLMLYLFVCHTHCEDVLLQESLRTVEVGDSVILTCKCLKQRRTSIVWIKHIFGERPLVIATSYQDQPGIFHNAFDKTDRFNLTIGHNSFNLGISKTDLSDVATYYCAVTFLYDITFGQGTLLLVKASKSPTLLQQLVLNPVNQEDSVTLQCTVLTESCAEEHSVYWFRHGSGESHPGIIYTHGDSSDQCKKSSESGSPQSCVYELSKNLSHSDAGTYYCAVAACGEIFFGNGTKLDFKDGYNQMKLLVILAIVRSTVVLLTFIIFLLCYLLLH